MSLFRLENVVHRYRERRTEREIQALAVDRLSVEAGEILTVVGPNGSGKSTLLEIMAFLRRPTCGRVYFQDRDVWQRQEQLAARREVPMLLQRTVLFSTSVQRNVMFGLRARGVPRRQAQERAMAALELVGMEHLAERRHNELSGGEQRRAALARVLALESPVIVLDEPTSSLDRESEYIIEEQVRAVNRAHATTIIMASHNLRQAVALSTRIVNLHDGKVLPENLDNVMSGWLRRGDEGFEYKDTRGWHYLFRAEWLSEDSRSEIPRQETPVQIAIPSTEITLSRDAGKAGGPEGVIDSVRQGEGFCRLRICLEGGPSLHAELKTADYLRLGFNLGVRVGVGLKPGAVRVLGRGPGQAGSS